MYLIHYPLVVWMQFALLDTALPAIVKAAIVFSIVVAGSWIATAALRSIPFIARLLGTQAPELVKAV